MKFPLTKANKILMNYSIERISSSEDWKKIEPSSKKKLFIKKPPKFFEMRVTSGSTGKPLHIYYSREAVNSFIKRTIKSINYSNVNTKDIALNLFAYGGYIPGSMYERACNKMKVPIIPLGGPNTYSKEKIIAVINKIKPTTWFSLPSYAIGILKEVKPINYPEKIIVAGEKLFPQFINQFKECNIEVFNHFGLTECPAIGVSRKNLDIIEVIEENIIVENQNSSLLVTDLSNLSQPIIRYKTGDVVEVIKENNEGMVSQFKILSRNDDLIKIRGVLISKTEMINKILNYSSDFYFIINQKNNIDTVQLHLDVKLIRKKINIMDELSNVPLTIELIFHKDFKKITTSTNKVKYLIDERNQYA